ncbi:MULTISPECIES: CaiB/BaiF CoA-transferase family protein [unclassified Erythrobacter]|uniref:CaiB/BaiF CoA transferase family protein n=1 Tax=unclassified Erythrobacter TaxID=2633097 RepID=UPI0012692169|nr:MULTISPECIES: CaiB/BaiF CoA-transferase family protein [unclassified Erythrobacter]QFT77500.1 Formyl-coenzyme A transferase [Erythrobacter sp. THAF29]UAB78090.1 CoA transferase [Erythrobacter sp. SCSIO 43205]
MTEQQRPLAGIRIVEIEGIGPAPFCGMHLADMGADVILVERKEKSSDPGTTMPVGILKRGKRSIALDLKDDGDKAILLDLVASADALIEGMRPGVMERLGLGPDICQKRNPALVYGRITGWGQDGPLSQAAGHDINYVALSSAGWYAGTADGTPLPPPAMVGDLGGGANYLTIGVLAGIVRAKASGKGDIVDAAIVDGSAHMMNLIFDLMPKGLMKEERGVSALDGAPWYGTYRCADGTHITVGSLEPKFYAELLERLGLSDNPLFANQFDPKFWPEQAKHLAELFASQPSAYWCTLLEGSDACFAPVLSPSSAKEHPHNQARGIFDESKGYLQAGSAPRFASSSPLSISPAPGHGEHDDEILQELKNTKRR